MIYVASHTVRSRQLSMREGVNAFIYQPDAVPNDMAVSVAMEKLSDAPGRMTGCSIELPPGGNEIDAYLDLVVADDDALTGAFEEARQKIVSDPASHVADRLGQGGMFRFYASIRVEKAPAFDRLHLAALAAMRSPPPTPLRIVVEHDDGISLFQLEKTSAERLRRIHGDEWNALPLRVHADVVHDFEAALGPLVTHVIEVITGLGLRHVEGLGGVVIGTRDGVILKRWPAATWMGG